MGGAGEGDSNLIGYAHDVTARAALDLAFGVDLDRRAALEPIEQAWPTPINAPRERGRCRRLPPVQRHGAQFAEIGDAYTRRAARCSRVRLAWLPVISGRVPFEGRLFDERHSELDGTNCIYELTRSDLDHDVLLAVDHANVLLA